MGSPKTRFLVKGNKIMSRMDDGLAFMVQYENVAWYQDGIVKILDRRIYPKELSYVVCQDYHEVAQAIADMVTQSGGPWMAALQGMVMTAYKVADLPLEEARQTLRDAAYTVTHARPTTSERMVSYIQEALDFAEATLDEGGDLGPAVEAYALHVTEKRYQVSRTIAGYAVDLLPDKVTILTQCFAETLISYVLLVCKERGKDVSLICPETRPYLQGARLTASVAYDMGIPVRVITDNMPGFLLSQGIPDVFICAADVITLDGHVVNKIGTYQIALAAHDNGIPFFVVGSPAADNPTIDTVTIEQRNPEEVVHAMGVRTAMEGVQGYYPAFDITPPKLVSGVVTTNGVLSPYDLARHFGREPEAVPLAC
jgi:methylthioribose-1-phosphate isomerase